MYSVVMKQENRSKEMKMKKISIKRNLWGNLNGYIGGRRVVEFGLDKQAAVAWFEGKIQEEIAIFKFNAARELSKLW